MVIILGNSEAAQPQIMWDWAGGINLSRVGSFLNQLIWAGITDVLGPRKGTKLRGTRRRTKNASGGLTK